MPELRRPVAAALAALVWAGALLAQVPAGATPQERSLLARADSLFAQVEARREERRQRDREQARARLVESGGLAAVVPGQASPEQVRGSLDSAARLLQAFGGVPEGFAQSVVVVFTDAFDTAAALTAPLVHSRQRVLIGGIQHGGTGGSGIVLRVPAAAFATAIATAYRDTRDGEWRAWLPGNYGIGPWTRAASWGAFEGLTAGTWAVGSRCLDGDVTGCRLWLGLDRDSSPFRARYAASEIREYIDRYVKWMAQQSPAGRQCLGGADAACFEYAAEEPHPVPPFPADESQRRSLVRAVSVLHGADALARALTDTAGSVGERLSRAAGISEDSLVREWRDWVLTRGGRSQDRNLLADAAPAVLLAGLLLAAARRSRG